VAEQDAALVAELRIEEAETYEGSIYSRAADTIEAQAKEISDLEDWVIRTGDMLSAIVRICRGDPPSLTSWSTHDAVDQVQALRERVKKAEQERDAYAAQLEAVRGFCDKALDVKAAGSDEGETAMAALAAVIKREALGETYS
jgi:cob(I)alamin adenosyltransferase